MPNKLSYEEFLESLRLAPRLVVEVVATNDSGEVLLLKRDIEPFLDYWHLPGGFLLKDETLEACFRRVSLSELGIELNYTEGKFLGLFENINGDPRGHILHYVVAIKAGSIPTGKYFKNLPEKIISYQKEFLIKFGIL